MSNAFAPSRPPAPDRAADQENPAGAAQADSSGEPADFVSLLPPTPTAAGANINFYERARRVMPARYVEKNGDQSYVSWAVAYAHAGLPSYRHVLFDKQPFRQIFGGAAVAVEFQRGERSCRYYLPVLDGLLRPIAVGNLNSRKLTDVASRVLAKGLAMHLGVGISLYAGFDGDGERFMQVLGVQPGMTDLLRVRPRVRSLAEPGESPKPYVDWASALVAASVTDPDFHFEVMEFDDENGLPQPYLKAGAAGFLVGIRIQFRGRTHEQLLAIMNERSDPIVRPNVFDWNKAVMRCLAKAVAIVSGYGLSVYAGEDLRALESEAVSDLAQLQGSDVTVVSRTPGRTERFPHRFDEDGEAPAAPEPGVADVKTSMRPSPGVEGSLLDDAAADLPASRDSALPPASAPADTTTATALDPEQLTRMSAFLADKLGDRDLRQMRYWDDRYRAGKASPGRVLQTVEGGRSLFSSAGAKVYAQALRDFLMTGPEA